MIALLDLGQAKRISEQFDQFKDYLKTTEASEFIEEINGRIELCGRVLGKGSFDSMTEIDLRTILEGLFAFACWGNKSVPVNRVFKSKDFPHLKSELRELLWGSQPLEERYDKFRSSVGGLGPSSSSELMAFARPMEYGLWNEPSRKGLKILGLDKILPTDKYSISGKDYAKFNGVLKEIQLLMQNAGIPAENLVDVDLFLYYVSGRAPAAPEERGVEQKRTFEFDHDEMIEKLVEIGSGMGFDAESEYLIAKGARVDAIWTARIGNLGTVTYVFEVQKGGSIDSLILNLQRAKNNPAVQKLVVVATPEMIEKIKGEVANLGEDFRKSLAFIEVRQVARAAGLQQEFNGIISKLELVKP